MNSDLGDIEEGPRQEEEDTKDSGSLLYGIEDNPPISQTVLLGFQLFLSMFSCLIVLPLILTQLLCIKEDISVTSQIISATFFAEGITTFLQATFGTRLPIIQGCSFTFVPTAIALLAYYGECSGDHDELHNETETRVEPAWKSKLEEVASRRVTQTAAVIMVVVGIFQRLCSVFTTIPDPVIGGTMIATSGMLISVGISLLQKADINSSRNLFVLGIALFLGIVLPQYVEVNPDAINTGLPTFDKCVTTLLGTGMFISFVAGVILDNIVPGTLQERGLSREDYLKLTQSEDAQLDESEQNLPDCYEFPFGMSFIRRCKFAQYIPISPTFRGFSLRYPRKTCKSNCEDVIP